MTILQRLAFAGRQRGRVGSRAAAAQFRLWLCVVYLAPRHKHLSSALACDGFSVIFLISWSGFSSRTERERDGKMERDE